MSEFIPKNDDCLKSMNCDEDQKSVVQKIIPARSKDLGGFFVRRVLPFDKQSMVGPWVFFDHMGPAEFPPGEGIDVRPHPHINLATVTYLFEGEIWHRDSLGSSEPIRPGDVNLMVAGRGIVHSERTRSELRESGQKLHGLQLWMALPEQDEETEPVFYHHDSQDIPRAESRGVPVRVMMGSAYGVQSPVKTFGGALYVEARLQAGDQLELPQAIERGLYVAQGRVRSEGKEIGEYNLAVFAAESSVVVEAISETFLVIIGGDPLGERHLFWNFVSSRKERIEQAKKDWVDGKFPKVSGDDEEFIPLPES